MSVPTPPQSPISLSDLLQSIRSSYSALTPAASNLISSYFSAPSGPDLQESSKQIDADRIALNNEVQRHTNRTSLIDDWRTHGLSSWESLSQEVPDLPHASNLGDGWTEEQKTFWQACVRRRKGLRSAMTQLTDLEGRIMGISGINEGAVGSAFGPNVEVNGKGLASFTSYDPFLPEEDEQLDDNQGTYDEDTIGSRGG
ncbi:hypothetical protein M231_00867 [Tremella mesenterica]|uniref:Uncharacterized protein n=1 Tax=Tremella mesenterica TaxID=5217 RepID=A0A4Q1BUZ2_TREME|nr:hypothetical protein M231_00867 [Tremella mesenterica]